MILVQTHEIEHIEGAESKLITCAEMNFLAYYCMELVVVLCVHRCYLFINKDWTWNRFDAEIILPKPGASFTVEQRARACWRTSD